MPLGRLGGKAAPAKRIETRGWQESEPSGVTKTQVGAQPFSAYACPPSLPVGLAPALRKSSPPSKAHTRSLFLPLLPVPSRLPSFPTPSPRLVRLYSEQADILLAKRRSVVAQPPPFDGLGSPLSRPAPLAFQGHFKDRHFPPLSTFALALGSRTTHGCDRVTLLRD